MNRSDGTPVNAVYGFTNMLVKLIEDYGNEKLIVVLSVIASLILGVIIAFTFEFQRNARIRIREKNAT